MTACDETVGYYLDGLSSELPLDPTSTDSSSTGQSTTPLPASSATAPTSTSANTAEPSPATSKPTSKALIAGVVVGAVALIIIAGLLFWFLVIRRKNKRQSYQQAPQVLHYPPPSYVSPEYPGPFSHQGYLDPNGVTPTATPYQDQKNLFSPNSGSQDPRYSYYAHSGVPGGPTPVNSPPPGELPGTTSPVTAELPGSSEASSKNPR
ncbi:hypothetical protein P154DRAFT_614809 [Amniculicola lignicola CBS 123094]|uniref:Mid2 domain-containing protein n=1 Tax=Amniculicola lignicola CBS 123094 TaxID=1392246 RepID=A0A6A5X3K7_9PLEO|nr:hypothetical protein P154DRAFT_614809 [Amniculicola lignicola CBS 123094]